MRDGSSRFVLFHDIIHLKWRWKMNERRKKNISRSNGKWKQIPQNDEPIAFICYSLFSINKYLHCICLNVVTLLFCYVRFFLFLILSIVHVASLHHSLSLSFCFHNPLTERKKRATFLWITVFGFENRQKKNTFFDSMGFKRRKMIAQRKILKIRVVETTQKNNNKKEEDVPAQTEWIENNKEIKKSTNRWKN